MTSEKEFQRQMRAIEKETSAGGPSPYASGNVTAAVSSGTPYGIIALVSFLAGAGAFIFGLVTMVSAFACAFIMAWGGDPGNSIGELKMGGIIMSLGLVLFIVSGSFGGASVATGNQKILGWVSIALSALPFLWLLASFVVGEPLGFSADASSTPSTPEDGIAFLEKCSK